MSDNPFRRKSREPPLKPPPPKAINSSTHPFRQPNTIPGPFSTTPSSETPQHSHSRVANVNQPNTHQNNSHQPTTPINTHSLFSSHTNSSKPSKSSLFGTDKVSGHGAHPNNLNTTIYKLKNTKKATLPSHTHLIKAKSIMGDSSCSDGEEIPISKTEPPRSKTKIKVEKSAEPKTFVQDGLYNQPKTTRKNNLKPSFHQLLTPQSFLIFNLPQHPSTVCNPSNPRPHFYQSEIFHFLNQFVHTLNHQIFEEIKKTIINIITTYNIPVDIQILLDSNLSASLLTNRILFQYIILIYSVNVNLLFHFPFFRNFFHNIKTQQIYNIHLFSHSLSSHQQLHLRRLPAHFFPPYPPSHLTRPLLPLTHLPPPPRLYPHLTARNADNFLTLYPEGYHVIPSLPYSSPTSNPTQTTVTDMLSIWDLHQCMYQGPSVNLETLHSELPPRFRTDLPQIEPIKIDPIDATPMVELVSRKENITLDESQIIHHVSVSASSILMAVFVNRKIYLYDLLNLTTSLTNPPRSPKNHLPGSTSSQRSNNSAYTPLSPDFTTFLASQTLKSSSQSENIIDPQNPISIPSLTVPTNTTITPEQLSLLPLPVATIQCENSNGIGKPLDQGGVMNFFGDFLLNVQPYGSHAPLLVYDCTQLLLWVLQKYYFDRSVSLGEFESEESDRFDAICGNIFNFEIPKPYQTFIPVVLLNESSRAFWVRLFPPDSIANLMRSGHIDGQKVKQTKLIDTPQTTQTFIPPTQITKLEYNLPKLIDDQEHSTNSADIFNYLQQLGHDFFTSKSTLETQRFKQSQQFYRLVSNPPTTKSSNPLLWSISKNKSNFAVTKKEKSKSNSHYSDKKPLYMGHYDPFFSDSVDGSNQTLSFGDALTLTRCLADIDNSKTISQSCGLNVASPVGQNYWFKPSSPHLRVRNKNKTKSRRRLSKFGRIKLIIKRYQVKSSLQYSPPSYNLSEFADQYLFNQTANGLDGDFHVESNDLCKEAQIEHHVMDHFYFLRPQRHLSTSFSPIDPITTPPPSIGSLFRVDPTTFENILSDATSRDGVSAWLDKYNKKALQIVDKEQSHFHTNQNGVVQKNPFNPSETNSTCISFFFILSMIPHPLSPDTPQVIYKLNQEPYIKSQKMSARGNFWNRIETILLPKTIDLHSNILKNNSIITIGFGKPQIRLDKNDPPLSTHSNKVLASQKPVINDIFSDIGFDMDMVINIEPKFSKNRNNNTTQSKLCPKPKVDLFGSEFDLDDDSTFNIIPTTNHNPTISPQNDSALVSTSQKMKLQNRKENNLNGVSNSIFIHCFLFDQTFCYPFQFDVTPKPFFTIVPPISTLIPSQYSNDIDKPNDKSITPTQRLLSLLSNPEIPNQSRNPPKSSQLNISKTSQNSFLYTISMTSLPVFSPLFKQPNGLFRTILSWRLQYDTFTSGDLKQPFKSLRFDQNSTQLDASSLNQDVLQAKNQLAMFKPTNTSSFDPALLVMDDPPEVITVVNISPGSRDLDFVPVCGDFLLRLKTNEVYINQTESDKQFENNQSDKKSSLFHSNTISASQPAPKLTTTTSLVSNSSNIKPIIIIPLSNYGIMIHTIDSSIQFQFSKTQLFLFTAKIKQTKQQQNLVLKLLYDDLIQYGNQLRDCISTLIERLSELDEALCISKGYYPSVNKNNKYLQMAEITSLSHRSNNPYFSSFSAPSANAEPISPNVPSSNRPRTHSSSIKGLLSSINSQNLQNERISIAKLILLFQTEFDFLVEHIPLFLLSPYSLFERRKKSIIDPVFPSILSSPPEHNGLSMNCLPRSLFTLGDIFSTVQTNNEKSDKQIPENTKSETLFNFYQTRLYEMNNIFLDKLSSVKLLSIDELGRSVEEKKPENEEKNDQNQFGYFSSSSPAISNAYSPKPPLSTPTSPIPFSFVLLCTSSSSNSHNESKFLYHYPSHEIIVVSAPTQQPITPFTSAFSFFLNSSETRRFYQRSDDVDVLELEGRLSIALDWFRSDGELLKRDFDLVKKGGVFDRESYQHILEGIVIKKMYYNNIKNNIKINTNQNKHKKQVYSAAVKALNGALIGKNDRISVTTPFNQSLISDSRLSLDEKITKIIKLSQNQFRRISRASFTNQSSCLQSCGVIIDPAAKLIPVSGLSLADGNSPIATQSMVSPQSHQDGRHSDVFMATNDTACSFPAPNPIHFNLIGYKKDLRPGTLGNRNQYPDLTQVRNQHIDRVFVLPMNPKKPQNHADGVVEVLSTDYNIISANLASGITSTQILAELVRLNYQHPKTLTTKQTPFDESPHAKRASDQLISPTLSVNFTPSHVDKLAIVSLLRSSPRFPLIFSKLSPKRRRPKQQLLRTKNIPRTKFLISAQNFDKTQHDLNKGNFIVSTDRTFEYRKESKFLCSKSPTPTKPQYYKLDHNFTKSRINFTPPSYSPAPLGINNFHEHFAPASQTVSAFGPQTNSRFSAITGSDFQRSSQISANRADTSSVLNRPGNPPSSFAELLPNNDTQHSLGQPHNHMDTRRTTTLVQGRHIIRMHRLDDPNQLQSAVFQNERIATNENVGINNNNSSARQSQLNLHITSTQRFNLCNTVLGLGYSPLDIRISSSLALSAYISTIFTPLDLLNSNAVSIAPILNTIYTNFQFFCQNGLIKGLCKAMWGDFIHSVSHRLQSFDQFVRPHKAINFDHRGPISIWDEFYINKIKSSREKTHMDPRNQSDYAKNTLRTFPVSPESIIRFQSSSISLISGDICELNNDSKFSRQNLTFFGGQTTRNSLNAPFETIRPPKGVSKTPSKRINKAFTASKRTSKSTARNPRKVSRAISRNSSITPKKSNYLQPYWLNHVVQIIDPLPLVGFIQIHLHVPPRRRDQHALPSSPVNQPISTNTGVLCVWADGSISFSPL